MTDKQTCNALAKVVKTFKEYRKACLDLEKGTKGKIAICEPFESIHVFKGIENIAELIGNECVTVPRTEGQYYDEELQTVLDGVMLYEIAHSGKTKDEIVDDIISEVLTENVR